MTFKEKIVNAFRKSIIISALMFCLNKIYDALKNGFVGKLFTSYSKAEEAVSSGFIGSVGNKLSFMRTFGRNAKKAIAGEFERSSLLGFHEKLGKNFLRLPIRSYGVFFFTMSIYVGIVYAIKAFAIGSVEPDDTYIFAAGLLLVLSVPMMISKKHLAFALLQSKFLSGFLLNVAGIPREKLELPKADSGKVNIPFIAASILGALTFFFHPIYYLYALAALLLFMCLLTFTEFGILLILFMTPFLNIVGSSSLVLTFMLVTITFGYFIKWLRGKRVFEFGLLDFFILLFAVMIFFGGTVSAGGQDSLFHSLVCCAVILSFFTIENVIRTPEWLRRCVTALTLSGFLVSIIGIAQYFLGFAKLEWLDKEMFSGIPGRVTSTFGNPNVLAVYLTFLLPLVLFKLFGHTKKGVKVFAAFELLAYLLCIVLTWSRAAWLATLAIIVIFFLIYSRKSFIYFLVASLGIPFYAMAIPGNVITRFSSIGNLADSSSYYRLYTWRGVFDMLKDSFATGIGAGSSAFAEVYPMYAYAGIESVEHAHSLYLQIMTELGIFGLVVFIAIAFFFLQCCFEFIKNAKRRVDRTPAIAGICTLVGALVFGFVDYVWYNYRVFFFFWAIMALTFAYIQTQYRETKRKEYGDNSETAASIDL